MKVFIDSRWWDVWINVWLDWCRSGLVYKCVHVRVWDKAETCQNRSALEACDGPSGSNRSKVSNTSKLNTQPGPKPDAP